jgi:very-short-patch-repair endonuclease
MSGARHYGIWAPLAPDLEVAVKPHARGLRTRFDATKKLSTTTRPNYTAVAWRNEQAAGRTVLSPIWCIDEIARTQSAAIAFGATESALHLGYITLADVAALIAILPRSRRGRLDEARGASESGGESLFRFHASGFAPRMRQQVRILGVGFVDFLIGDRLVVEIDGAEFHTSAKKFEEDRRRDARLRALGYRVLRFSYKQVEGSWSVVAAAMAAALADGDHRAH